MDFVIEKGFLLSPLQLSEFFLYGNLTNIEQSVFKKVCDVAEKQALYYQKMNPTDESFDLVNATRAYLVDIIPHVKFYWMEKAFLKDFVVPKGIITEEQANHVSYTRVQIENNGKTVVGIFDDFGIGILYAI
uniref:Uncharacterized protein n=1 Tax=Panagrolaimus sp. ES5 TaxID=591445 RepID=A0AC34GIC4_9BILA